MRHHLRQNISSSRSLVIRLVLFERTLRYGEIDNRSFVIDYRRSSFIYLCLVCLAASP
jgi:hypothetical protein